MDEQSQQEMMQKFGMFEQQIQQLQQQMQAVNQVLLELQSLDSSLDDLKESKDKEILASVGRGIYAKAKLISEDLIVDIGGGNFVNKDIQGTREILNKHINQLNEIKKDLDNAMSNINEELTKIFLEAQKKKEN